MLRLLLKHVKRTDISFFFSFSRWESRQHEDAMRGLNLSYGEEEWKGKESNFFRYPSQERDIVFSLYTFPIKGVVPTFKGALFNTAN